MNANHHHQVLDPKTRMILSAIVDWLHRMKNFSNSKRIKEKIVQLVLIIVIVTIITMLVFAY